MKYDFSDLYEEEQLNIVRNLFENWVRVAIKKGNHALAKELEQARDVANEARAGREDRERQMHHLEMQINYLQKEVERFKKLPKQPLLPLNELKVPPRILYAFEAMGFRSVGDVIDNDEKKIRLTRGMGKQAMAQLKSELARLKLKFRSEQ